MDISHPPNDSNVKTPPRGSHICGNPTSNHRVGGDVWYPGDGIETCKSRQFVGYCDDSRQIGGNWEVMDCYG